MANINDNGGQSGENFHLRMVDFGTPLVVRKRASYRRAKNLRRILNFAVFIAIFIIIFGLLILAFHTKHTYHIKHNPVVETECGPVQGVKEQLGKSFGYVFKGIPFAKPPFGNQRWKPPQRLKSGSCWRGIFQADKFRDPCYQFDLFDGRKEKGSEDCLYLDIWTRRVGPDKKLPVMVYIHGGDLTFGSSHMPGTTPNVEFVNSMNIVAVSISYRVNAFGFLALDVLSRNSKTKTSGNYGFMDQIIALEWIKNNIQKFGGDPSQMTVVGHGSGATSIYGLLASRKANGLFSKAVAMSGSPVFSKTAKEASKDNEVFLNNSKCDKKTDNETLECLYNLSASEILHAVPWSVYPSWGRTGLDDLPNKGLFNGALCVVDGDIIATPPGKLGQAPPMPRNVTVMIGTTAQEIAFLPMENFTGKPLIDFVKHAEKRLGSFAPELPKRAIDLYRSKLNSTDPQILYTTMASDIRATCPTDTLSTNFSTVGSLTVYRYVVTNRPSHPARFALKPTKYAAHVWDESALFGFHGMPFGYHPEAKDLKFRDRIRKAFLEFFKTGKPITDKWMTYPSRVGIFGNENLVIEKDYNKAMCKLWNEYNLFKYGWIN